MWLHSRRSSPTWTCASWKYLAKNWEVWQTVRSHEITFSCSFYSIWWTYALVFASIWRLAMVHWWNVKNKGTWISWLLNWMSVIRNDVLSGSRCTSILMSVHLFPLKPLRGGVYPVVLYFSVLQLGRSTAQRSYASEVLQLSGPTLQQYHSPMVLLLNSTTSQWSYVSTNSQLSGPTYQQIHGPFILLLNAPRVHKSYC